MEIKQINNLKYRYNKNYNKWQVISPDKKVLEEFVELENALLFMKETFDFCTHKTVITAIKRKIKELNGFVVYNKLKLYDADAEANFSDENNAQEFQDYCDEISCVRTSTVSSGYKRYYLLYKIDK